MESSLVNDHERRDFPTLDPEVMNMGQAFFKYRQKKRKRLQSPFLSQSELEFHTNYDWNRLSEKEKTIYCMRIERRNSVADCEQDFDLLPFIKEKASLLREADHLKLQETN